MDRKQVQDIWLKLWRELSDPGVLHFVKTSAKNEEGEYKSGYEAERTCRG